MSKEFNIEASRMEILQEAAELKSLADSDFYSDSHLTDLSEKFKAKFGCNWLQVLDSLI